MKIIKINHYQPNRQTNQNNYSTNSFTGITRQMNKHTWIDGQRDIKPIVDAHSGGGQNLTVGKLPKFILDKLPPENREEAIVDIYNTFDEIVDELREFDETKVFTIDEIKKRRNNSTVEKYDKLLKKYKLIPSWDDADILYLGKGGKGAGYKLEGLRDFSNGNEDEFIIKVFHLREGRDWQYYKSHGCYAELNSAAYWMKNVGFDTDRGKFFWGNAKSGYMVNKFIDEDVRLPKRYINSYDYGLKCTDESVEHLHNVCKTYKFDWGGVRIVNRVKNGDKYARTIFKDIENTPEKFRSQEWCRLYTKKSSNPESKYAGLAISIKYLENKPYYIDLIMNKHCAWANTGLAYVLKYLPYETSKIYFEKLMKTKDPVTQITLMNEIPLLAMKHRDDNIKDDLQTTRSEILPSRIKAYYDLAEKYAMPESIEHLASFVHMLPQNNFKTYYKRLGEIDNVDLKDRMIYKLSNVSDKGRLFAMEQIANGLTDKRLQEKLLSCCRYEEEQDIIKNILDANNEITDF